VTERYGRLFQTATEEEVRRLLQLAENGHIVAWAWLIEWTTGNAHSTVHDPRTNKSATATPDVVLAYFEDSEKRRINMAKTGSYS